MNELTFDNLQLLHLLWAVLAVAALGVYGVWQRHRALRLFATAGLLARLAPPIGWTRALTRLGLVLAVLVPLVGAIIGPRWGEREQRVMRRNVDVMVLLDVSRSMLARDIAPNRLERAKVSIKDDLLPALGGDRIGLITFAGLPTLKCPLTNDYGYFRLVLDDVSTKSSPRGGTLIGDAIRRAGEAFDDERNTHKMIILITDGEDHESRPVEAARWLWKDHQIPIVAIALGDERDGARIPVRTGTGDAYLEHEGSVVWSKADFDGLRRVAREAGGSMFERLGRNNFVAVGTRDFPLGRIYREVVLPVFDYSEVSEAERIPLPSRYHVFAIVALVLLLIESFIRDAPRKSFVVATPAGQEEKAA